MVHQRQRLPLGFEAGDHLPRVHAGLDDLERHLPLDRLGLLGHEDDAHAAFADLLQQLVRADDRAGALADRMIHRGVDAGRWCVENEALLTFVLGQQPLDTPAQRRVLPASRVEESPPGRMDYPLRELR